jgi:hypothetical protein
MENARKAIQLVRVVLAAAVLLYLVLIVQIPSTIRPNPLLLRALGFLAIIEVVLIFIIRRIQVFPSEAALESQPEDAKALVRWKAGYIVTYALSLSIAMYGLVLHFLGFGLPEVAPFLLAGLALIAFLGPKVISNPSPSAPIVPR